MGVLLAGATGKDAGIGNPRTLVALVRTEMTVATTAMVVEAVLILILATVGWCWVVQIPELARMLKNMAIGFNFQVGI